MREENILKEIVVLLKNHNEDYVEGAWENFQEKRKKKSRILFFLYFASGMAATFFVAYIGIAHLITDEQTKSRNSISNDVTNTVVHDENSGEKLKEQQPLLINIPVSPIKSNEEQIFRKPVLSVQKKKHIQISSANQEKIELGIVYDDSKKMEEQNFSLENDLPTIEIIQDKQNGQKFKFGLVVKETTNSTAVSSNIACAVGVVNDIKLTNKIAVNTGIILGKYNLSYASTIPTLGTPNEEQIYTGVELVCFDIPLNLKINIKEINKSNIFIVSGISTLAFVKEKYQKENLFGTQETSIHHFENINFSGQFNFSLGWQYKIFNNAFISIETYAKLPLYELAEDNLHFYQTGISLSLLK